MYAKPYCRNYIHVVIEITNHIAACTITEA